MRTKGFSSFLTPVQSCQQHTAPARASLGSSCTMVHNSVQREITHGIQLIQMVPVNPSLWLAPLLELRSHLPGSSSTFTTICITVVAEKLISEPMAVLGSCAATEIGLWDEIQLTKPMFLDLCTCNVSALVTWTVLSEPGSQEGSTQREMSSLCTPKIRQD